MRIRFVPIALFLLLPVVSIILLGTNASPLPSGLAASFTGVHLPVQADQEFKDAQQAWNERLQKSRNRVKDMERRMDQTEIEINRLCNFLSGAEPRSTKIQNQTAAHVAELTAQLHRLRDEAVIAQEEADAILAEGAAKKFKVESLAPTTPSGEPNLLYYRARFDELQMDRRDSELRAWVMQLRITDLNRRITLNSGTGDNFFIGRLRDELQQAQRGMELARARLTSIARQLDELREQARAAGVSPDDWR